MKNKTWTCLVVVSAALLMAGCGSRTKKQTNEDVSMDSVGVTCSGVKTLQLEGVQATWIQDNAGEHLMPRTIFPDASDELMESLSASRRYSFFHEHLPGRYEWYPYPF